MECDLVFYSNFGFCVPCFKIYTIESELSCICIYTDMYSHTLHIAEQKKQTELT